MDNLNGMHHHPGGGAAGTVGGAGCHATPTSNCTTPTNLPDHSVTVTVGGPMLHRSSSSFSNVGSSSSNPGSFGNQQQQTQNPTHQINLNASAIVATTADCCSPNFNFEETKELLARHLRRCCDPNEQNHSIPGSNPGSSATTTTTTAQGFEGLDLGGDDHTPVPLGDLLEKLQAETDLDDSMQNNSGTKSDINDLIRLHSVEQNEHPTISATVNVATLDLSDPESIHQHLSQLNDAVLRVTTHDNSEDYFDNNQTSSNDGNHSRQQVNNQSNGNTTISISIPGSNPGSAQSSIVTTSSMAALPSNNAAADSISNSSTPLVSPTHTTIPSSPASGSLGPAGSGKPKTPSSSPATPRKSGSASGSKASPQSCSVCSKVFSNASALAKHRLTHSEERRYHCNICGKAFKRQDHLNGHLLTHRSTKPFACHVEGCGKSYCDARSLRRHKENHHGQAKAESSKQSDTNQTSSESGSNNKNNPSNAADQLISKSVLGDTKIKFSSKGLTAQQLQLIEQLFKQTKVTNKSESDSEKSNATSTTTTNNNTNSTNSTTVTNTTTIQAPLNAAVKKNDKPTPPLPDKPVECTICSRKFKNIPALNGHMRLHGGYYKKDADGRRLVGMANTSPLKTMAMTAKSNHAKLSSENLKRKANPGDHPGSSLGQDPQAKKAPAGPAGLSVTYCQPQVTSLPSFAFSNLPQPDTSKLLANLEQKTKQMMNNPGCNTSNHNTNCNTTTSSLRAMRKQPSFSTSTVTRNPNDQGLPQGAPTMMTHNHHHNHHHHHHSHQHQNPNLTLPIVALPTKPLPVQMTSTANDSKLIQGLNNGTSIQITALIQSNSNPGDFSSHGSHSDFMVQASTQDCGLMNNIPLVNNMLSCMHHQTPSSSTSSLAVSSQKSQCTNLLKVDETSDKTPKIGSDHQVEVPPFITDVKPSESAGNCITDVRSMPIWQPETANSLSELEFNQYLVVASSCAVGGGSHNEEVALELLQKHGGNVQYALQDMLSTYDYEEDAMSLFSSPEEASDSEDDSMSTFKSGRQPWQPYEVDLFYEGLVRYHKNFTKIARHVGTKSVKDCVEFYYLWKNICHEESQSFKSLFTQSEIIGNSTTNTESTTAITEAATSSFSTTSTTATSSSTAGAAPACNIEIGQNGSKNTNPTTKSAMEVQSGPSSVSSVV